MSITQITHHNRASVALVGSLIVSMVGAFSFVLFEPVVGQAQTSNPHDFTVTQTITDEISFLVEAADVTMVGTIQGLSGGYATGTTYAVVRTNDQDGYSMTLEFSDDPAMNAVGTTTSINDYTPAADSTPDYNWTDNSAGQAAEFGYTVYASNTSDVVQKFLDNGSACGTGSNNTLNKCWYSASTTPNAETIVNRSTESPDGATTTLRFKVAVPSNPSPALPADTYVATGTLTATNNP